MIFDHVGLITDEKKGDENFVEATRVWVTNPKKNKYNIEWLRFEPDTPLDGPVRYQTHVAYRVDNLQEAAKGLKVLIEPFEPRPFVRVGFYETHDGGVVELMKYTRSEDDWFDDEPAT